MMTDEEYRERLRQKITSFDELRALYFERYEINLAPRDEWWAMRESERFDAGVYSTLHDDIISALARVSYSKYSALAPHKSEKSPGLWAYTENADKGARDIQSVAKPGKFMKTYFGDMLSDDKIRDLATMATPMALKALKFAETADQIAEVFRTGPQSCMSGHKDKLMKSPVHPVRVYATIDPPVQIAYVQCDYGSITARAVVDREQKKYIGSIYGDGCRLGDLLKRAGFHQDSCMLEDRYVDLTFLPKFGEDAIMMPYIDGECSYINLVSRDGDTGVGQFTSEDEGYWNAKQYDSHPCGVVGYSRLITKHVECQCCYDEFDADSLHVVYVARNRSEQWCEGCCENHATCFEGEEYSESGLSAIGVDSCDECEELTCSLTSVSNGDGHTRRVCENCEGGCVTAHDGMVFEDEDAVERAGYLRCSECKEWRQDVQQDLRISLDETADICAGCATDPVEIEGETWASQADYDDCHAPISEEAQEENAA